MKTCRGRGAPEQIDALGYTTIAPYLDCISRAMKPLGDRDQGCDGSSGDLCEKYPSDEEVTG